MVWGIRPKEQIQEYLAAASEIKKLVEDPVLAELEKLEEQLFDKRSKIDELNDELRKLREEHNAIVNEILGKREELESRYSETAISFVFTKPPVVARPARRGPPAAVGVTQAKVLEYIQANPGATLGAIVKGTELRPGQVSGALRRLKTCGKIRRAAEGGYEAV